MPSRRQERVGKRVVQELTDALRNLNHVNLGFVTVTRCDMSPDLRHAKVFVSIFGSEEEQERGLSILKGHASRLKGVIGRPLGLKVIPDLHFEFDDTLATADRISRLIREARKTDANSLPLTPEEEAALLAVGAPRSVTVPQATQVESDEDPFDVARRDVEEELDIDDSDPDWTPIDLNQLPVDDD